jgi:Holliday junction DNA helicase RuvA
MYSFIEGNLDEITPTYAVIHSYGIGYFINISLNTYTQIKEMRQCRLFIHLVVREDALLLFGFADQEERKLFRDLIAVTGIGPNTARVILSSFSPSELAHAITTENVSLLQRVKGIGSKSAQRIVLDLKDKLSKESVRKEFSDDMHNRAREEALSGLIMLGFNKHVVEKTLDKILNSPTILKGREAETLSVEELIKLSLQLL